MHRAIFRPEAAWNSLELLVNLVRWEERGVEMTTDNFAEVFQGCWWAQQVPLD